MPQTREHFHICRLLGIPRGAGGPHQVRPGRRGACRPWPRSRPASWWRARSSTARRCCASRRATGEGLRRACAPPCASLARRAAAPARGRPAAPPAGPRLHAARVRHGGHGHARVGHPRPWARRWRCCPSGPPARACAACTCTARRSTRVEAGHRAAVNLAGVDVADVARGDVLARPGTLRATSIVDAELTLLAGRAAAQGPGARARARGQRASPGARARAGRDRAWRPGATAPVQLRLERPAVAGRGDRLVVRSYSPAVTIGGALVRRSAGPQKRRRDAAARAARPSLGAADAAAAAVPLVEEAGTAGIDAAALAARVTVPLDDAAGELPAGPRRRRRARRASPRGSCPASALDALAAVGARRARALSTREQPLKAAMPREELRRAVFARGARRRVRRTCWRRWRSAASCGSRRRRAWPWPARRAPDAGGGARRASALLDAARAAGLAGLDAVPAAGRGRLEPRLAERVSRGPGRGGRAAPGGRRARARRAPSTP